MIYEAKMPHQMWCYAVEYAVYLKNRFPTAALLFGPQESDTGSAGTPFEAYKHAKPNVSKLRVFGCATWPSRTGSFLPKSELRICDDYIFIGMTGGYIWKLLYYKTLKEAVYADAGFNEYL